MMLSCLFLKVSSGLSAMVNHPGIELGFSGGTEKHEQQKAVIIARMLYLLNHESSLIILIATF